jgi:preprotein translocase subunit SecE
MIELPLMQKILNYFGEVKVELQKVTWPSREQTINLTWLVIGVSAAVALYLGVLDAAFQRLVEVIIGQ